MINIMLVDDEPLLLESLEIVLTIKGGFNVCGTAGNGVDALELLKKTKTDVMLIDLNMPEMGGIELIKRVNFSYPEIRMIVLTTFYDEKNIAEAISNGASGYLLKDSGKDAVIDAVEQAVKGVSVLDSKVMQKLTHILGSSNDDVTPVLADAPKIEKADKNRADTIMDKAGLTSREKEIAGLIAEGCTNSQIASILFITEGTVKNYVSSIYDKFDIKDRARLILRLKGCL